MNKISFQKDDTGFTIAVKAEVGKYFSEHAMRSTGNWKLYLKALAFISMALILYVILLTASYDALTGILLCLMLGITLAGIAMNVMHDACHGSFSSRKWVNRLMAFSMNALGSNAFLWKVKHNIIHHTYTNISGIDSDIENWPLLRQHPNQRWLPVHRYQHVYMFLLYAVTTLHWMLFFDFEKYFTRRFANNRIRNIPMSEHLLFWISKCLYGFFYIAIPVVMLGWRYWLAGFLMVHITMGLVLIIVFQLAHLVEKVSLEPGPQQNNIAGAWFMHELKTTANFAQQNSILSWYLGGLNFQVEHHLFPRICHIHYPAISKIIRHQCGLFQLPYHSYHTVIDAIRSHIRLMRRLGSN